MKVLLVPYCFYPESVGGTEVYVESLAQHLQAEGIEAVVAAAAIGLIVSVSCLTISSESRMKLTLGEEKC